VKSLSFVKTFLFAFLIVFNVFALGTDHALAYDSSLPVYVNEEPSGYKAVVVNGEWYIKLRDICAIYFVEINYDDATQTITIYDEPTPTKLKLLGDKVAENEKMFVENGYVYVPLKNSGVVTFKSWHKPQGHLDVQRTFSFNNGSWSLNDSRQQVGDFEYAVFDRTGYSESTLNKDYVWQFKTNGCCRAVAVYWRQITSFVVDGDDIFIVGRDTWNASDVMKFSLIDGTETRLGQLGYDYGDNLTWAAHYSPDIEPLPHTGMVVREDGVYTVGYSRAGFFENNVIDKDIFLDTYAYYRLDKNGGKHEKVANWPE
jgi:hypothetical protein